MPGFTGISLFLAWKLKLYLLQRKCLQVGYVVTQNTFRLSLKMLDFHGVGLRSRNCVSCAGCEQEDESQSATECTQGELNRMSDRKLVNSFLYWRFSYQWNGKSEQKRKKKKPLKQLQHTGSAGRRLSPLQRDAFPVRSIYCWDFFFLNGSCVLLYVSWSRLSFYWQRKRTSTDHEILINNKS